MADVGKYTFRLYGYLDGYSPKEYMDYTITIVDPCLTDTISYPALDDYTVWIVNNTEDV